MPISIDRATLTAMARAAERREAQRRDDTQRRIDAQRRADEERAVTDLRAYFGYNFGDLDVRLGISFMHGIFADYTGPVGVFMLDGDLRLISVQDSIWWIGTEGQTRERQACHLNNRDIEPQCVSTRADQLLLALAASLGVTP